MHNIIHVQPYIVQLWDFRPFYKDIYTRLYWSYCTFSVAEYLSSSTGESRAKICWMNWVGKEAWRSSTIYMYMYIHVWEDGRLKLFSRIDDHYWPKHAKRHTCESSLTTEWAWSGEGGSCSSSCLMTKVATEGEQLAKCPWRHLLSSLMHRLPAMISSSENATSFEARM